MIPVFQTKFGGSDKPEEEQGDCLQACIASIFEIPLAEAPDFTGDITTGKWWDHLIAWCKIRGMFPMTIRRISYGGTFLPIDTWYIGSYKSLTLPGDLHVVVCYDAEIMHDPNPKSKLKDDKEREQLDRTYFVSIDPSKSLWMGKRKPMTMSE